MTKKKTLIDLETLRNKYKNSYVTYSNILTKLAELDEELQLKERLKPETSLYSQKLESTHHDHVDSHNFSLPPCDIEIFRGDYATWPTFRDLFTAVFIKNSRLSPVEKLFHLTQKTKGEARDIVRKSPLTNSGFELAWSSLCTRYENRRVLVNGQLKTLFNLASITSETGTALKQLQRDINSCISVLKLYDIPVESWDPVFVFICSNRLPDITLTLWEQGLENKTNIPTWSELDAFLTNRYRTLESVSEIRKCPQTQTKTKKEIVQTRKINTFQNNIVAPKCPLCPKETHIIRKCPRFLKMDYSQKYNEIKRLNLCVNCFSKTHSVQNCSSKNSCFHCKKRHNSLLHRDTTSHTPMQNHPSTVPNSSTDHGFHPLPGNSFSPSSSSNNALIRNCFAAQSKGVLLGTAIVNIVHSDLPEIPLADPYFHRSAVIDILIGGDVIPSIMCCGMKQAVCGSLLAQETIFGWILTGPVTTSSTEQGSNIVSYFNEISLDKEISRFWEVEDLPRDRILSHSEKYCEELYKNTTTRTSEGRYVVSLPFKEGYPDKLCLGESRKSALAQFYRNEARLLRNPELKPVYDNVVQEYKDLNHMSEVSDANVSVPLHYYLPPPCRDKT
ncbi:hypothetical protein EVAR_100644_1 [Eumeta japonica]|uniref:Peptidase aspartic putative domain-containing protein n=1 Tax=Eumeta variegata TaxID=151549 RepID=A0A4C1T5M4_EUMVA|nr:hypothetical protein EVAR_100644_1 [Eumeta japonica]